MASSCSSPTHRLLLHILVLLFAVLVIRVNARSGAYFRHRNTVFISSFTATSFKTRPHLYNLQNPNSTDSLNQNPSHLPPLIREIMDFHRNQGSDIFVDLYGRPYVVYESEIKVIRSIPFRSFYKRETFRGLRSLSERTEHIVYDDAFSLMAAYIFGALTVTVSYFVMSLIANWCETREMEADDNGDCDDVDSPNQMGYIKIPVAAPPTPSPAKEGV